MKKKKCFKLFLLGIIFYLFSLTLHELGHLIIAQLNGFYATKINVVKFDYFYAVCFNIEPKPLSPIIFIGGILIDFVLFYCLIIFSPKKSIYQYIILFRLWYYFISDYILNLLNNLGDWNIISSYFIIIFYCYIFLLIFGSFILITKIFKTEKV